MTTTEQRGGEVRPFTEFLEDLSHGRTLDELSEGLAEMVAAVKDTGKGGSIVLTVKVEPLKGSNGALKVSDAVVVRAPKHDRRVDVFYADALGSLVKTDPAQPQIDGLAEVATTPAADLREAPAPTAEVRDVAPIPLKTARKA